MNVLLIVVDTLRADHLGCYGHAYPTSPAIDALARRGTRFARCLAQANATHPSFTTIFTGCDPLRHGVVGHFGSRVPDPALPMLGERFQAGGFATAAVDTLGRWFERGFDRVERYVYDQSAPAPLRSAEEVNARALPLLRELAPKPYFLFLHYWDPHTPYLPPPPYGERFAAMRPNGGRDGNIENAYRFAPLAPYMRGWIGEAPGLGYVAAQYDAEIAYLDAQLAALFAEVERLGLPDDTLIVVTGDHGESLTEHGIYFDHHGLYEPQLHVPLIMAWPGHVPEGTVFDAPVRHTDLAPTLLDLAGLPPPAITTGQSLVPALKDRPWQPPEAVFACEASWQLKRAVRTARWTYIEALQPDRYGTLMEELYDREADPGETVNVVDAQPEQARPLRRLLERWVGEREQQTGAPDVLRNQGVTLKGLRSAGQATSEQLRERVRTELRQGGQAVEGTPEEEALVEERLRNLGYL